MLRQTRPPLKGAARAPAAAAGGRLGRRRLQVPQHEPGVSKIVSVKFGTQMMTNQHRPAPQPVAAPTGD